MDKFKILQIGSGAEYGGGSTYLLTLMNAIGQQGWEVHFACTPGLTLEAVKKAGFSVFPVPAMQRPINPWADFRALIQLIKIIRNGNYDLVHTHTSKGGFLGRLAAKITGVPAIIHTVHGFAFHEHSSRAALLFYVTLEKIAAYCCDRMISVNHEDRLKAIELGIAGPDKIITIQNGIDTTPFDRRFNRGKIRREFGVEEDQLLIGTVARLAPQKAPFDFVHAAAYALAHRSDLKFIMVGDGPLRAETEQLIRQLDLSDYIIVTGHRTDVPELLAAMDVFMLTSLWEGLPISLLEAMAMSKPVIVTDIKGSREVVKNGETGYLVPPKDPEAAGEALLKMLAAGEEAKKMGARGRHLVDEVFNAKTMTQNTISVYRELLHNI